MEPLGALLTYSVSHQFEMTRRRRRRRRRLVTTSDAPGYAGHLKKLKGAPYIQKLLRLSDYL